MCEHLGLITRFPSVDRRHVKGLAEGSEKALPGQRPCSSPGELGVQIGKRQTFNWTLNRGATGWGPEASEECRSQLVMSATSAKEDGWQVGGGYPME